MKIQFLILLFLVCVNLSVTLAVTLGVAGTEYFSPFSGGTASEYSDQFNASNVINDEWDSQPFNGVPILGDVFGGLSFFFNHWEFLISGGSYLLRWIGDTYFTTTSGISAWTAIADVLFAVYSILMFTLVFYIVTGREI